ncbi:MAG: DUF5916 domain-containing protein [Gemmatimonadota bacterium]|jgi:hypothetical protein
MQFHLLVPLILASGPGPGPSASPLELHRLNGPIVLDGRLDDDAWAAVPLLPLTQYAPVFGATPMQRTEIRVAYDDEYLYAAGAFYDDDPGGIRINSLYRDRWNGDDAFAIYVDPFNDNRNAKWFGTTPAGIRFDLLVSDDGATLNGSWDAFWDVRTRITENGWFAEVRIPFSSLGFQARGDETVMGLTVTRLVSRTGERVTFPAIDPKFEFRQPSVAQDVVVRTVGTRKPLYASPWVLAGAGRMPVLAEAGDRFVAERESPKEAGLDLRYGLSSELTLDVTINTDFAQVEADDQQVNLDRFSLFFPEKRRFFQERSELFDFVMGGSRLFHSRRIGLNADAEAVRIPAGARLVGRAGTWDIGVLDMQTGHDGGAPGENFAVARVRHGILNPYSNAGLMLTNRSSAEGSNTVLGADAVFRLGGDTYLTTKLAGSIDDEDPDGTTLADRSGLNARLQRRVNRGLFYSLDLARLGPAFDPGIGFLPRRDFSKADFYANWFFFKDDHPWLRRIWPGMLAFSTFRNADRSLESGQYAVWVQWDTKKGGGGWIEPKYFVEDVAEPFVIGGQAEIPAGRYTYADLQVALQMSDGARLRTDIDARAGTFFDGTRVQFIAGPTWNASPHLELGADYQYTRLRFPDRDQQADIHVARLRVRSALDARLSGNAFVQLNSTTDRLDLNLRLRYNFGEGTDLWLVYNEGLATDRALEPGLDRPFSLARTLLLKYSHTFVL